MSLVSIAKKNKESTTMTKNNKHYGEWQRF